MIFGGIRGKDRQLLLAVQTGRVAYIDFGYKVVIHIHQGTRRCCDGGPVLLFLPISYITLLDPDRLHNIPHPTFRILSITRRRNDVSVLPGLPHVYRAHAAFDTRDYSPLCHFRRSGSGLGRWLPELDVFPLEKCDVIRVVSLFPALVI